MVQRIVDLGQTAIDTTPIPVGGPSNTDAKKIGILAEKFLQNIQDQNIADERQAQQSYLTALKLEVNSNSQRIGGSFPNNPARIKDEGSVWINGFVENVPPRFQREMRARFNKGLGIFITGANKNSNTLLKASQRATSDQESATSLALTKEAAKGLLSSDPNQVQASQEFIEQIQIELFDILLTHVIDPVTGEPIPVFSPEEVRNQLNEQTNLIASTALLQGFIDSPDQVQYILDIKRGEGPIFSTNVNVFTENAKPIIQTQTYGSRLTNQGKIDLEKKMEDILKFQNDIQTEKDADEKEARENLQDVQAAVLWRNFNLDKSSVSTREVINSIDNESLSGTAGLALIKAVTEPEVKIDDTDAFNDIAASLERGEDITQKIRVMRSQGLLKGPTMHNFMKENEANRERDLGIDAGPRKTLVDQQRSVLKSNLQPESDFLRAALNKGVDPDENIKINNILTEYNRLTEDPNVDPVKLVSQLSERGRTENVTIEGILKRKKLPFGIPGGKFTEFSRRGFIDDQIANDSEVLKDAARKLFEQKKLGNISQDEFESEMQLFVDWETIINMTIRKQRTNELRIFNEKQKR